MIRGTLRTITGRRGTFVGGGSVLVGLILVAAVVLIVLHALRPGRNPSTGGQHMLDSTAGIVGLVGVVVAILVGSLAGSYDVAQGTMRFIVSTGAARPSIYAARTVATLVAIVMVIAPALVLGVALALALPHRSEDGVGGGAVADVVWASVLNAVVYGLIGMGIGTLLRSNGPAIAISLLFAVGLAPVLLLVSTVNETVGDMMLPNLLDRLTGGEQGAPLVVAVLALGSWVGSFWLLGLTRVVRDEY